MAGAGLAESFKKPLRRLRSFVADIPFYWGKERYCPVCEKASRKFGTYGVVPRRDARCVWCGALERHRLTWLYFTQKTDLFDGRPKRLLHIAAEPAFEKRLGKHLGTGYLTADLFDPRAMVKMDVADICFPDEAFEVIYCSHVLESVPDDQRAIRELYRVLKGEGWAVLLSSITAERTIEDPAVTDPQERTRLFGQADRVRRYGMDFTGRLQKAGFMIKVVTPGDFLNEKAMEYRGITRAAGEIFYCTKQ